MQRRCLHVFLIFLVLAQPVASAAASAAMVGASLASAVSIDAKDIPGMDMPGMDMSGCHDTDPAVPDCCAGMEGVSCGMDCGTVSPALGQPRVPDTLAGHGAFEGRAIYAAPSHSPGTFLKPPRTS
jgi:hypothetical protein